MDAYSSLKHKMALVLTNLHPLLWIKIAIKMVYKKLMRIKVMDSVVIAIKYQVSKATLATWKANLIIFSKVSWTRKMT